jgi:hypothetical protein
LTLVACISLNYILSVWINGPVARGVAVLKVDVYQHLLCLNASFDRVLASLAALRKHAAFEGGELARFSAWSKEVKAATNSYLLGIMEAAETEEAGRRFHKRLAKERSEE